MTGVTIERVQNPEGLLAPGPGSLLPQMPPHDPEHGAVLKPMPVGELLEGHPPLKQCRPHPKNACPAVPSHVICLCIVSNFRYQFDPKLDITDVATEKSATTERIYEERLKRLRDSLGLRTQNQLAVHLQVSTSYLADVKTGKAHPGRKFINSLFRIGANPEWFLTGEGEMLIRPAEKTPADEIPAASKEVKQYLMLAREVLSSDNTLASDALERNIVYFAHAVRSEKRLAESERRLVESEKRMSEMEAVITTLKRAVNQLEETVRDIESGKEEGEGGSEQDAVM